MRYVAFLRAINVGKRIVKMERLRELFGELGLRNVETFIASGQVIFESRVPDTAKLERKIEQHLLQTLGYEVAVFIRTAGELAGIAQRVEPKGAALYVGFIGKPLSKAAATALNECSSRVDDLQVHGREIYWMIHSTHGESALAAAAIEKAIAQPMTMRNLNTINRLVTKYDDGK